MCDFFKWYVQWVDGLSVIVSYIDALFSQKSGDKESDSKASAGGMLDIMSNQYIYKTSAVKQLIVYVVSCRLCCLFWDQQK